VPAEDHLEPASLEEVSRSLRPQSRCGRNTEGVRLPCGLAPRRASLPPSLVRVRPEAGKQTTACGALKPAPVLRPPGPVSSSSTFYCKGVAEIYRRPGWLIPAVPEKFRLVSLQLRNDVDAIVVQRLPDAQIEVDFQAGLLVVELVG
jgi:hypothetical protein